MKTVTSNKLKILNDPIYGFIRIPNSLIFDIIEHPYFQRLRRISQMGLSNLVYPGANHTRFHHAVGCLDLMQKTVRVLRVKGIEISDEEENALCIAILLHDIGHGPFSHALEHSIVSEISHEEISLLFMKKFNEIFHGKLDLSIAIFTNKYHRKFFNQLISSQLDIDRLDYLKRDSFYTGVTEGNISSDRLIAMMNVVNDELVIEKKGIYSVEKFLIARRLMYWQVYLHKTGLVAENMMVKLLQRSKELADTGVNLSILGPLNYFLNTKITADNFTEKVLEEFSMLDDIDVFSAVKIWMNHPDKILSTLSKMLFYRKLFKIDLKDQPIKEDIIKRKKKVLKDTYQLNDKEVDYFVFTGTISNQAYNLIQPIKVLNKKGNLKDIAEASDQLNLQALSKPVVKHFICYPKKMLLA
ncbi:MAG: HD domain-containing protein [Flavobacteriaceae bacterium]